MLRLVFAITLLLAPLAKAEVPSVVTSIAPIQGLVADIMTGIGTPELLLAEPTSSHDFALRPSQARAIYDAQVLFYIGQNMEPWIEKAVRSRPSTRPPLGKPSIAIGLSSIPVQNRLTARELDEFGEHHEDHDHDHDHEGAYDPHMWLDPENVLIWLEVITRVLETADPDNKNLYRANLERTLNDIAETVNDVRRSLVPLAEIDLIVTHDSIQYFEVSFDLNVIGAFSASDGQAAGARSLSTLLDKLGPNTCIVEDITHPSRIAANLPDNIKHVTIDPMGYEQLGEGYYPRLLSTLAQSLLGCLD